MLRRDKLSSWSVRDLMAREDNLYISISQDQQHITNGRTENQEIEDEKTLFFSIFPN